MACEPKTSLTRVEIAVIPSHVANKVMTMIIITEVVAAVRLLVVSAEEEVSEAVLAEEASVEEWAAEVVPVHDSSQFTTPTKT